MKRWPPVAVVVALLAVLTVPAALASSTETVRDEFRARAYDGNDGTQDWVGPWDEFEWDDGVNQGPIQVSSSSHCAADNCLRIGGAFVIGSSIARAVAIPTGSDATLSFSYKRQSEGDAGRVWVNVSENLLSWDTLTTIVVDRKDSSQQTASFDLSEWAGKTVNIAFIPFGEFDGGFIYIDNVQVAMTVTNEAPSFSATLGNQSNAEGQSVSLDVDAVDPDGDTLTYSATGLPPGITINSGTGAISGTVDYSASAGSPYSTSITVDDGHGGSDQMSFSWTVSDTNRPPTLAAISNRSVAEGSTLSIQTSAADPDLPYDVLTYALHVAPAGASIDSAGKISWKPTESDGPGTYDFTVKVYDSGTPQAYASRAFTVNVSEVNVAPKLDPIPNQANGAGDQVTLEVDASDSDLPANTLTYSATGLPAGLSIGSTTGVINGTIPASTPGATSTVTVKVRDNGSPALEASATFTWTVTKDNRAPILSAIPDKTVAAEDTLRFTAAATDPDPGDTLSFWLDAAADPVPSGARIDATSGKFTWTPTEQHAGATYKIKVGVTDSGTPKLSDYQVVEITVPAINQPPTVEDPGDQESAEGDEIQLEMDAGDPDGSALTYKATGLPSGLTINARTGVIAGNVDYDAAEESPYDVTITVSDGGIPIKSATAAFSWVITDTNRPPVVEAASYVAVVDEPLQVVLAATDPDGDDLEYEIAEQPGAGALTGTGPNLTYLTAGGANADRFTFVVSDGEFEAAGVVTIEIRETNHAPTAVGDEFDVAFGETLNVVAPGLLANDSDRDGDALSAAVVSGPDHGQVALAPDGSFQYTPNSGFSGVDEFVYEVTDATGLVATARVAITVAVPSFVDDPRIDVLVSTTSLRSPVDTAGDESVMSEVSRAVVFALNSGISTIPSLGFPLLLLLAAVLLGLTLGRISLVPAGALRRRREGWVQQYDATYGVGRLTPTDDSGEVFVQATAVTDSTPLVPGQRVRFVASDLRGRRIAIKVWPAD